MNEKTIQKILRELEKRELARECGWEWLQEKLQEAWEWFLLRVLKRPVTTITFASRWDAAAYRVGDKVEVPRGTGTDSEVITVVEVQGNTLKVRR